MRKIGYGNNLSKGKQVLGSKAGKSLAAVTLAAAVCASMSVSAITITSVFTDLPDSFSGQDLWKVSYTVSGGTFVQDEGFSVIYDHSLFSNFTLVHAPDSGQWDSLMVPYDAGLNANGFLDALALVNNPTTADTFDVTFLWLGAGSPGVQGVELYQIDPNNPAFFNSLGTGQTVVDNSGGNNGGGSGLPETGYGLNLSLIGVLVGMGYVSKRYRNSLV
jgi:hypothetical protein